MGLLGHMIGGALQGVGQGITMDAQQKRATALEAMRQQYQTNREDVAHQRTVERESTNHTRTLERDETQHGYRSKESAQGYKQQAGLLAIGGQVQAERDERQHTFTMKEIGAKHVQAKEMAVLESNLAQGRTEAELKLRDQLATGEIKSVVKGADGTYYGVTDKGLVSTGVAAPEEAPASSGRDLTEGEIEALYRDRHNAWRSGGKKGPEPTRTQVIQENRSKPAPARREAAAPAADSPAAQREKARTQLATVYPNATPDRYPGLFRGGKKIPMDEALKMIDRRYAQ